MRADLTSPEGITPSRSPSMGSAKRLQASLISPSSRAETLCSLASLDWRGALPPAAPAGCCCFDEDDAPATAADLRFGALFLFNPS